MGASRLDGGADRARSAAGAAEKQQADAEAHTDDCAAQQDGRRVL